MNFNEDAVFSFGDPEPIRRERVLDYLGVFPCATGEYYLPPIDLWGLATMRRANGHHGSCVIFRRNMAARAYVSGPLPVAELRSAVTDFLTWGNAYFAWRRNRLGVPMGLQHVPGLNMRVKTPGAGGGFRRLLPDGRHLDYAPGEILHVKEYDCCQQIYGVPDWIGGLQAALLNEDATLFRRRYYVNGAHLGYILYSNDAKIDPDLRDAIKARFREGKGIGNFKSAFIHIPNGNEKALQVIPIGDISQKDEFLNVKNISADDVRAAHRVPPVLMGLAPTNGVGGLGDPVKVRKVYIETEVEALAQNFTALNEILPTGMKFIFNTEVNDV